MTAELNQMMSETKLLEVAVHAAGDAGKILRRLFGNPRLAIRKKNDYAGSLVTRADEESEKAILARIRRNKVACTVVSEEAGMVRLGSREVVWAVDPLDGTLNYVKRIPHFAVSIGILRERKTIAGVIYNPMLDEMFTAIRGHGAHLDGKRIRVSRAQHLRDSSLIFEWWVPEPSIPSPLQFEERLCCFTRRIRSPGSVALNLCSVAAGRFDGLVTVFRKAPVFETASGSLITQEAGGIVTNSLGESWENFSRSLLAGGSVIHTRLLSLVASARAKRKTQRN